MTQAHTDQDVNKETAAPSRPLVHFTRQEWLIMLAALALAVLFCHCFDFYRPRLIRFQPEGPGLGFSLFLGGGLAVCLGILGKRACYSRENKLLLAAWTALALSFTLTADPLLRRLNMLVMVPLTLALILALSGLLPASPWSADSFGPALRRFFPALFKYWPRPLAAVAGLCHRDNGAPWPALLAGLALALPLLVLALTLLSAADAVFRGLFQGLGDWLSRLELGRVAWVSLRSLFMGLVGFSLLYTLTQPPRPLRQGKGRGLALPLLSWTLALGLLDAVYLLFTVIQFAFLFGGTETAAMSGGYAQYAREGFFQLVLVSLINLGFLTLAQRAHPGRKPVRLGGSLLLACTLIILISAAWRMRLYIQAYGLTMARLLTWWGMAMLLLALVLAALKLWRPQRQVSPLLLAVAVAAWIAFNYCGPDALIAGYNVDGYIQGRLEQVDEEYMLRQLSPAARPSLERLAAAHPEKSYDLFLYPVYKEKLTWTDWSLPWLIYVK